MHYQERRRLHLLDVKPPTRAALKELALLIKRAAWLYGSAALSRYVQLARVIGWTALYKNGEPVARQMSCCSCRFVVAVSWAPY